MDEDSSSAMGSGSGQNNKARTKKRATTDKHGNHLWTPAEWSVVLALLCRGVHNEPGGALNFATKLNEALNGKHQDERDIPVAEVEEMLEYVRTRKRRALEFVEGQKMPHITRAAKLLFARIEPEETHAHHQAAQHQAVPQQDVQQDVQQAVQHQANQLTDVADDDQRDEGEVNDDEGSMFVQQHHGYGFDNATFPHLHGPPYLPLMFANMTSLIGDADMTYSQTDDPMSLAYAGGDQVPAQNSTHAAAAAEHPVVNGANKDGEDDGQTTTPAAPAFSAWNGGWGFMPGDLAEGHGSYQ